MSLKGSMQTENKSGPKTEPCGTPQVRWAVEEDAWFTVLNAALSTNTHAHSNSLRQTPTHLHNLVGVVCSRRPIKTL